ncbi:MAG: aminotransferase class I and II [Bacteroidetes bacterium]|nr:aminotransferase class I and II [Bacteroidota bacterium]
MFPVLTATRYVTPLREGGSLPAILEAEGGGYVVAKFRGAGQGARALIAELIVGGLARAAGLPVPAVVLVEIDESFGRSERDPEIQDILKGSRGVNVGLGYLSGAFNYDPLAVPDIDPDLAADIVWLDAYVTNIDRTARNPNMLVWEGGLWLIDHGAALYFHHNWDTLDDARIVSPFAPIRDHVLLPLAGDIAAADRRMSKRITPETIAAVTAALPDSLLMDSPAGMQPAFASAGEARAAYARYLTRRLEGREGFVKAIVDAQEALRSAPPIEQRYRR